MTSILGFYACHGLGYCLHSAKYFALLQLGVCWSVSSCSTCDAYDDRYIVCGMSQLPDQEPRQQTEAEIDAEWKLIKAERAQALRDLIIQSRESYAEEPRPRTENSSRETLADRIKREAREQGQDRSPAPQIEQEYGPQHLMPIAMPVDYGRACPGVDPMVNSESGDDKYERWDRERKIAPVIEDRVKVELGRESYLDALRRRDREQGQGNLSRTPPAEQERDPSKDRSRR